MKKTTIFLALFLSALVVYAQETAMKTKFSKMMLLESKPFPQNAITVWSVSGQKISGDMLPAGIYIIETLSLITISNDGYYLGNQAFHVDNDTLMSADESHQMSNADLSVFLDDAGSDMVFHGLWHADSPCSLPDSITVFDESGSQVLASVESLVNPVNTNCQGTELFWRDHMIPVQQGGRLRNVERVGTWADSLAMLQTRLSAKTNFVDSMQVLLHYVRNNVGKGHEADNQFVKLLSPEKKHEIFVATDSLGANCIIYTDYFHTLCKTVAGIDNRDIIAVSRNASSGNSGGHTFSSLRSGGKWYVFDPMNCGVWTLDGIPADVQSIAAMMATDSIAVSGHYTRESRIGFDNSSFPETIKLLHTPLELWGWWSMLGCVEGVYKTRSKYHESNQDAFITDTLYGCIGLGHYQQNQVILATRMQVPSDGSAGNMMIGSAGFDDMFNDASVYSHWTSLLVSGMITNTPLELHLDGDPVSQSDFLQNFMTYHHP